MEEGRGKRAGGSNACLCRALHSIPCLFEGQCKIHDLYGLVVGIKVVDNRQLTLAAWCVSHCLMCSIIMSPPIVL